ncbi:MAG: ComEC/Rec2 family competence protein [Cellulosilyticaceae bacterium]
MKHTSKKSSKWLWSGLLIMVLLVAGLVASPDTQADTSKKPEVPTQVPTVGASTSLPDATTSLATEVHFIDTGNSDAILIRQGDKAALIDGGDNDDEQTVVNYIKKLGIKELEMVFNTHPHADHVGGLDAVLKSVKVNQLYISNGSLDTKTYADFLKAATAKGLQPSVPLKGSKFSLGTSTLEVVSAATSEDPNNTSLVILMTNGKDRALFTGDAEADIEKSLLSLGDIDLLKVGHHGSHSSSSPSFMKALTPDYAVITVGSGNKYGHPHRETMSLLKDMQIPVYRTDENGTIIFTSTGNGFKTTSSTGSYTPGSDTSNAQTNVSPTKPSTDVAAPSVSTPPPTNNTATVYWTSGGKKYHSTPTCSNMKSPVSGSISEAGNRGPCSKCY